MPDYIFISHASKDDNFVKDLRQALESQGLQVWVDSRNLRGGNRLARAINQAIEQARQVIVVLSPNTVNSPWVRKEIQKALKVEKKRNDDGYRVIPLLLPGIEPSALALWFGEEPVAVPVKLAIGSVSEALPHILAALGERLPDDITPEHIVPPQPVEDLLLMESANCLTNLGREDAAAGVYQEAIKRFEQLDDKRSAAVSKSNLANIRISQGQYTEALQACPEARDTFAAIGEPLSVATSWYQIGRANTIARQFDQAEYAHRQALAIRVQQKDLMGEADSLLELGNLYHDMERLEEAVTLYQQAAEVYIKLQNLSREGMARGNVASILIQLYRYDEARSELQRALDCFKPYGHAAQPWRAWGLLYDIEQAVGNQDTATQARQQAVESFLAYRRAGGENQNPGAQLCAIVFQTMQQGQAAEAEQYLAKYLEQVDEPWAKAMIPKLQAILHGDRDPALAEDPVLDYDDAAELMLLLEELAKAEQKTGDQGSAKSPE